MLWDGPSLTMVTWRGEMEGIIVSSTLKNRGVDTTVPVEVVVAGFLGGKGQEYWVGHGRRQRCLGDKETAASSPAPSKMGGWRCWMHVRLTLGEDGRSFEGTGQGCWVGQRRQWWHRGGKSIVPLSPAFSKMG